MRTWLPALLAVSCSLVAPRVASAGASYPPPRAAPPEAAAQVATEPSVPDAPTHTFSLPTGATLGTGPIELRSLYFGLWNTAAVGVTDRLELDVTAPAVPLLIGAGARLALLEPRGPLHLTAGASAWTLLSADQRALSASLTAGYARDGLALHASAGALLGDRDGALWLFDLGVSLALSPRASAVAHLLRSAAPSGSPGCGCDASDDSLYHTVDGALAGISLQGHPFSIDVGLLAVLDRDEQSVLLLPIASLTFRR